jgi:hypothetical protein
VSTPPPRPPRAAPRVNTDLWGGLLLLVFGAGGLLLATGSNPNVWGYPRLLSGLLLLFGGSLAVKGLVRPDRQEIISARAAASSVGPFLLGLVAYYALLPRLGFVATTVLLYATATWALRRRFTPTAALLSLAVAAAVTLALYQLFANWLFVPLPTGSWWEAMGLA